MADQILISLYILGLETACILAVRRFNGWQKRRAQTMQKQLAARRRDYEQMQSRMRSTRQLRHDFVNHMETIRSLYSLWDGADVEQREIHLKRQLRQMERACRWENPVVNALMANKEIECASKDVQVEYDLQEARLPATLPDRYWVSVLSNLYDNAIEASLCIEEPKRRRIVWRSGVRGGLFFLSVENPRPEYVRTKKGPWHGLGLSVVRQIARRSKSSFLFHEEETAVVCTFLTEVKR